MRTRPAQGVARRPTARRLRPDVADAPRPIRDGATATTRARRRTAPGRRDEKLLTLIHERPGITVAEAGKAMSVGPTGMDQVGRCPEQSGDVRKTGRELHPAAG